MAADPKFGKVIRVRHAMRRAGKVAHQISDMIFLDGVPTVVIEWEAGPKGDFPAVTVPLDPQYLHKVNLPDFDYLYEFAVVDPRRTN